MCAQVIVLNLCQKAKETCKKGKFFRAIFVVKNYYGKLDKCLRKFLSLGPNVSDNFPVSYGQNKTKKTTEKFTTENSLCFDVHVHVNFGAPKLTWTWTSKHGEFSVANFSFVFFVLFCPQLTGNLPKIFQTKVKNFLTHLSNFP